MAIDHLIKRYARGGRFPSLPSELEAYVMTTVRNAALRMLKTERARVLAESQATIDALRTNAGVSSEVRRLLNHIPDLPVNEYLPVLMVDLWGFTLKETAEALGCGISTVADRKARAHRRLRDWMMGVPVR